MVLRGRVTQWRGRLYGSRALLITALGLVGLSVAMLFTQIISDVQWTGVAVRGVDRGGIVYYTYRGQNYSLDRTSHFLQTTAYLDPRHPGTGAELGDTYRRVIEIAFTAVPLLIALLLVVIVVRRLRSDRPRTGDSPADPLGPGLDLAYVRRLNAERRRDQRG